MKMTEEEIVKSVSASFEVEGFIATEQDKERAKAILPSEKTIEQVIDKLNKKWFHGILKKSEEDVKAGCVKITQESMRTIKKSIYLKYDCKNIWT